MNKSTLSVLTQALVAAVFTVMSLQSQATALGTLPNAPLFLSTLVKPNIFFTLDDSGSMAFGITSDPGIGGFANQAGFEGLPIIDGEIRGNYENVWSYTFGDWTKTLPPSNGTKVAWDAGWIFRNHNANKLYYNPEVTYTPWVGGDPAYANANPSSIPRYPWPNPPGNETIDLTLDYSFTEGSTTGTLYIPTYHKWVDDGDGIIQPTDTNIAIEIKLANQPFVTGSGATQLSRTYSEEIQNFANWFQYYRTREYAMKAAVGRVFNNANASRMGLDYFIGGHQRNVSPMSVTANKIDLLEKFYEVNTEVSTGGTPARASLKRVHDYFMTTGTNAPILSQTEGGECQQNFNILLSDGFWNRSAPSGVGNTDIDSDGIKNFDGHASESNDGGNYADAFSNTLADIAMLSYETDLRGDLDDDVNTTAGIDLADHQHLVTYSIAFGLSGTRNPLTEKPTDSTLFWPDPTSGNGAAKIDDLWHAAYNGRGLFLSANNATQLQAALDSAIVDISKRTGTAAAVAINSSKLSTNTVIYLAEFNSDKWIGDLQAFAITDTATGSLLDQSGPTAGQEIAEWKASELLTNRSPSSRNIITYNNDSSDGAVFQWGDISAEMQQDLRTNTVGTQDAIEVGQDRLNFIRGERSKENILFRERTSLLGDIVNSGPVFVGEPNLGWPDIAPFPTGADAYSAFKNGSAKTRQKIVYVGANDGMLHGFNDGTGEEAFAYIPGLIRSSNLNEGLHYLSEPNYRHKYYVDLTPSLSDVFIASSVGGTFGTKRWHTVLIGGLRGGGRGLYALDVTDPSLLTETAANAESTVLWEFTDPDLGFTYSRPSIALTNAGTWVAIFGNGYNDTGLGQAQLFIVNIEKGVDGAWQSGDYIKLNTQVGSTAAPNGLATPALADLDGNGTVDRVYAGDLDGNMWAFDLSDASEGNWTVANLGNGAGATPEALFSTPAGQPITAKPVLSSHPTQPNTSSPSNTPNLMVYFGTGQYLVDADKSSTSTQSFFGVWDDGNNLLDTSDLIEQTFDANFTERVLTRNQVDYSTQHGWYFNFPDIRERNVTSPIARGDAVFFNTFIPEDDPCVPGGFGFRFAVDMTTGGSPNEPTIDANHDNVLDDSDLATNNSDDTSASVAAIQQTGFLPDPVFIEDLSFTVKEAIKIKALLTPPEGRFSWQELIR